ncbi:uncharacterized protein LOC135497487 [Lineus longissimus]|uniref:uncharacterized protein LOC135497487 n=1 Tax=Lineus longissimus TaxID=88925 RepID=UPI002B4DCEC4
MSVSDPLLKKLKGYVAEFRSSSNPIRDYHPHLLPFCETIEEILRKGIKHVPSFFGIQKRDYWAWLSTLEESDIGARYNPTFHIIVSAIKSSPKLKTTQGRGRAFLRAALQKKALKHPIQCLVRSTAFVEPWYDPLFSIIGNEILSEIFLSLLHEIGEITFKLNLKNCTFLDETWVIPIYRSYEFVPCKDLGILVQYISDRVVVERVDSGSVAEEDGKIQPGDILDELYGEPLRNVKKGKMPGLLKQNQGFPVYLSVVKCHMPDGSIFPPVVKLLRQVGKTVDTLQKVLEEQAEYESRAEDTDRIPPHAQLPEDDMDEVPVSNPDDTACYSCHFVGTLRLGPYGGVEQIETAIATIRQNHLDSSAYQRVQVDLGETGVLVTDSKTKEEIYNHSYTEISACGRRVDAVEYFAYVAGETTCTLAKDFVCFVFKGRNDEDAKTILCSIAQGFERTHWFV